jgi:phthalate 4,5-dioxygenase oxygenase subunit
MLSAALNERLTHVGPGTPLGEVFRRYWLPALLSDEVPENDGPPVRVRLLGEDLVAFRDSEGHVGLVSAYCPHRRAPMFFGRNEECGLRCVYHGWKFDRAGNCVDMPSEPPDSLFKSKVRIDAYPTWEGGGFVWAFMGPATAAPPPPPNYELVRVPATHRVVSKTFEECNYVQALEGGLDNTHSSILHSRWSGDVSFLRSYDRIVPRISVRKTDYGYAFSATRTIDEKQWTRVSQYFMPAMQLRSTLRQLFTRSEPKQPTLDGHIWVPVDDHNTWVYNFTYSYYPDAPLPPGYALELEAEQGRGMGEVTTDFRLTRNRSNDYMIDRAEQKNGSFTGISGVNTQDYALQEGMGAVDRTKEHLGTIDEPIIVMRQLLLEASNDVADGRTPRGADPRTHQTIRATDDFVAPDSDWSDALEDQLQTLY